MSRMSPDEHEALAHDFLQMVDNPQLSDVKLVCEDGVEVHACRMVLAARSLFFRQMLSNGMAESRETSIALPTISSSVLRIVLKFLYAEVLLDDDIRKAEVLLDENIQNKKRPGESFRLDWKLLLKVVVAVRFLMLEGLEKVIIGRIKNDVPLMEWDTLLDAHEQDGVACHLSILCEYPMLWNANDVKFTEVFWDYPGCLEQIEAICFRLVQMMIFSELSPATLFAFSRKAFHLYLSKIQRTSSDRTCDWSFEEYLRLREIITWCAVRAADTEAAIENLDRKCLPGPEIALRFLGECVKSSPAVSSSTFSEGRESFVKNIHGEDLEKFLSMVDLVSIHPQLLVSVIEPLNLIDPLDWSRIYSVQAVGGSRKWSENAMTLDQVTDVWHWKGSGLYALRSRSACSNNLTFSVSVIPSAAQEHSMVCAAELKMEFSRRTFEWEIAVSQHGYMESKWIHSRYSLFEIGFYRLRVGESLPMKMGKHRCKPLSASARTSVLSIEDVEEKFFDTGSSKGFRGCYIRSRNFIDFLSDIPIKVTVNRENGTYSFSCEEKELTFPIDNAEAETFYPVVYISSQDDWNFRPHYDRLTIKIQELKGFDQ